MRKHDDETLYKIMFPDYPDVVSVAQFQKMLGISRHFAYELINERKITAITIGRAYRIPKIYVVDYIIEKLRTAEAKNEDETALNDQEHPEKA